MSDLRTRIAKVINNYVGEHGHEDFTYGDIADAVIRELDNMGIIHLSKRTPPFDNTRLEP